MAPRLLRLLLVLVTAAAALTLVLAMVVLVVSLGERTTIASTSTERAVREPGGPAIHTPSPAGTSGQVSPVSASPWRPGGRPRRRSGKLQRQSGGPLVAGRTVASYDGSTTGQRGVFTIPRPGNWALAWSYTCPDGQPGTFAVSEVHTSVPNTVDVAQAGLGGRGVTWIAADPGHHSLLVITNCDWSVRIMLPKTSG